MDVSYSTSLSLPDDLIFSCLNPEPVRTGVFLPLEAFFFFFASAISARKPFQAGMLCDADLKYDFFDSCAASSIASSDACTP